MPDSTCAFVRQTIFPFRLQKNPDPAPLSPLTINREEEYFEYSLGFSESDSRDGLKGFTTPFRSGESPDEDWDHEVEIVEIAAMRKIVAVERLFRNMLPKQLTI